MSSFIRLSVWALLLTAPLFSLEEKPWFGDLYEMEGGIHYAYSSFDKVNGSHPSLHRTWRDHLLSLNLGARLLENWSFEAQIQLDATTERSFGYSNIALQARYLWLDDIAGDRVSLSTGLILRETTKKSLHQLSTPYHGQVGAELHAAVGKEWLQGSWINHLSGFGAFGIGSRSSSWMRTNLYYSKNYCNRVEACLFLLGFFGFGSQQSVFLDSFKGWGQIAHRSLDLGIGLRRFFYPWGALSFDYAYRLYAHSYPQGANFFIFSYELPFSVL